MFYLENANNFDAAPFNTNDTESKISDDTLDYEVAHLSNQLLGSRDEEKQSDANAFYSARVFEKRISKVVERDMQKRLIEKVKDEAKENGVAVALNIQGYGIDYSTDEGQKGLIEIALIVAKQNGSAIVNSIQDFGIYKETEEGQRALIEIAKTAAEENGFAISFDVQNFGINKETEEGQKALIEIAKIAAEHNEFGISINIQNFEINQDTEMGQKGLIEIALIEAKKNGKAILDNIKNYGINNASSENQAGLVEIIKFAGAQKGYVTPDDLQNFGINKESEEAQKILIEIALYAASKNAMGLSSYIQFYGLNSKTIEGQRALIEIAKVAVRQNPYATSMYIRNFDIDPKTEEGQRGLIEIAKISAFYAGKPTLRFIRNYGISEETEEGQKALIEIAKLAVRNDFRTFDEIFERERFSNLQLELTCYALANISKTAQTGEKLAIDSYSPCYSFMMKLAPEKNSDLRGVSLKELKNFILEIEKLIRQRWPDIKFISIILKQIAELKKPEKMTFQEHRVIQFQQLSFFLMSLTDCYNLNEKTLEQSYLPIIEASLKLRDPKMREDIWNLLFKNNLSFTPASRTPSHAILPSLLLHYLEIDDKEISSSIQSLRDASKNIIFKDADINKMLLKTLLELYDASSLSGLQKNKILARALSFRTEGKTGDKTKTYKALQLIKGILACSQGQKLEAAIDEPDFIETLKQIYQDAVREIIPIKHDIINFSEKFEALQNRSRMPDALLVYAANLKKLNEWDKQIVLKALASCLEDVLEGTFKEKRYSESLHLETIFKGRETLKDDWTKGQKLQIASLLGTNTENKQIDYRKQLLIFFNDKHINKEIYPNLYLFLQTQEPDIQIRLNEQLKGMASEEEKKQIHLQLNLIELAQAKGNEKELLRDVLDHYLPEANKQFEADINWLYSSIFEKEKKSDYDDWTIEDTDSFEDLFLSGTEVEGSCQNINGDPDKNKCLLGYVMDGKNRLLAIKDSSGKIQARAILRLLLKGSEPVLLIERIYPKILPGQLEEALEKFALHRSDLLKLDLFSKEVGAPKSLNFERLDSTSGRAPYEYVDSQNGIHREGRFSIHEAYILNK